MDVATRYKLLEKIGAGSFATVYRAQDQELGREVAVKQIHSQYLADTSQFERYWKEATLLDSFQHPHIVTIYDVVRGQGWLILELMQANLRDRLQKDTGSTRLLVYVDQWEELYTQASPREIKTDQDRQRAADVKLFIDLVLKAAASSSCTLVLTVRSDFYPDIQAHDGLRVAAQNQQVSLGTMNEAELRSVIEEPPGKLGASVDPELTNRLIRDIGLDPTSGRSNEYDIGKLEHPPGTAIAA